MLLLSMPGSFEHMPSVAIRMPYSARSPRSRGNVDAHHKVAIADLVLVQVARRNDRRNLRDQYCAQRIESSLRSFERANFTASG